MHGQPACIQGSEIQTYLQNMHWPPGKWHKMFPQKLAGWARSFTMPTHKMARLKPQHDMSLFALAATLHSLNDNMTKLQKAGCAGLIWSKIWAALGPVGLQFPAGQGCRPHMQPRTARRAEPTHCVGTSHSRQYSWQYSSTCMDHLCVFKGWPNWSFKPIIKWKHVHPPPVVLYKGRKETVYYYNMI